MATLETIRQIIIRSRTEGVDKAAAELRKLGEAQAGVRVESEKSEKATLSAEAALKRQERALDTSYRAADQYRKTLLDLDRARAQGIVSQSRYAELVDLAAKRAAQGAQSTGLYATAQNLAATQAQNFAGRLGPMGALLTSVGPAGLAAGAAIGILGMGLYKASEHANRFAADMLRVRDTAETIGLTAIQFQAFADAGSAFALGEEKIGQALQRFTAQMDEFRRGQGELFDLVQRIDPALAREMAGARSTAQAMDYLAQVYERAGNARAKLDRMIGGRGGGTVGLLFQEVGRLGGMDALTEEFRKSGDAIDDKMIKRIAQLKAEIDDMSGDASRNLAAIYSVTLLQAQHQFEESFRDLSRMAREFATSESFNRFAMTMLKIITAGPAAIFGSAAPKPDAFASRFGQWDGPDVPLPASRPAQSGIDRDAMVLAINIERQRIGALGAAATAVERLRQREQELKLALNDNVISQSEYNRALGSAQLETAIQLQGRRVALLGDDARVQDVVAQKQREINLARAQGVRISDEENRSIIEKVRLQTEYARLQGQNGRLQFERDQLGRGDVDATVAARLRSEGLPIDLQSAEAAQIRLNEQLRIGKDLATDFASGFARDLRHGVDGMEALGNALGRLADRLLDMAVNNLVSNAFGGLTGGVGAGAGAGIFRGGLLGGAIIPGFLHEGGIVGDGMPLAGRFIHPAYFENAPRFAAGLNARAPGINEVPILAHKGEVVGWPDQMRVAFGGGSRGGDTYVHNDNRTFNDVTPGVMAQVEARIRAAEPVIVRKSLAELRKERGRNPNAYAAGG
jgi:hypothetical protein